MNYVEEIADKFLQGCRSSAALGPDDFTLIAEWEKQEIPKDVVIDAITLLAKPETRSLVELRSGVKEYFVNWLQDQAAVKTAESGLSVGFCS